MGTVIRITFGFQWSETYFVPTMDAEEAKRKAFASFKETKSCHLPDTLEDAVLVQNFFIEVLAEVGQIIL